MNSYSINDIKKKLQKKKSGELEDYCLRLAKYKKENKELLGYLLYESDDIPCFIEKVKEEIELLFRGINKSNGYFIRKSVRKILKNVNKYIRFSSSKQVAAELLIHFCNCILSNSIPIKESRQLNNLYEIQLKKIKDILSELHPDLQYDLKKQFLKS